MSIFLVEKMPCFQLWVFSQNNTCVLATVMFYRLISPNDIKSLRKNRNNLCFDHRFSRHINNLQNKIKEGFILSNVYCSQYIDKWAGTHHSYKIAFGRPVKSLITLIRVFAGHSVAKDPKRLQADSELSDQPKYRCNLVGNVVPRLKSFTESIM